jgi:hypothetical protein
MKSMNTAGYPQDTWSTGQNIESMQLALMACSQLDSVPGWVQTSNSFQLESCRRVPLTLKRIASSRFDTPLEMANFKMQNMCAVPLGQNTPPSMKQTACTVVQRFQCRYETFEVRGSVLPVKEKSGNYRETIFKQETDSSGRPQIGGWAMVPGCAYTEAGVCGSIQDFAPESKFELVIRVSNQITGWFRGRIQAPTVKIEKFSERNNRLTMSATSVIVPRLSTLIYKDTTSAESVALLKDSMRTGAEEYFKGSTIRSVTPHWNGIQWVEAFRKDAKDTAAGVSTLWNFTTLAGGAENDPCFIDKSRVIGVVTTNATAMAEATPDFTSGVLTYKVAGLHYAPDGKTLNEGSYDLLMRSDVARCLYHFTSAPLSATVSVIGDGGENKIATTVVSEKDGWLKIRAYGFSFSSPTISVKLTQASSKKVTITCVKGKLTKKVTAVGPKCPAGYKKK